MCIKKIRALTGSPPIINEDGSSVDQGKFEEMLLSCDDRITSWPMRIFPHLLTVQRWRYNETGEVGGMVVKVSMVWPIFGVWLTL
jgi:hypothetical protein